MRYLYRANGVSRAAQIGGSDAHVPFRSRWRHAHKFGSNAGPGIWTDGFQATSTWQRLVGPRRNRVFATSTRVGFVGFRVGLSSAHRSCIECSIGDRGGEDIALGAAAHSAGGSTIRRPLDSCAAGGSTIGRPIDSSVSGSTIGPAITSCAALRAASLSATAAAPVIESFRAAGASTAATRSRIQPTAHPLGVSFSLAASGPGNRAGRDGDVCGADTLTAAPARARRRLDEGGS